MCRRMATTKKTATDSKENSVLPIPSTRCWCRDVCNCVLLVLVSVGDCAVFVKNTSPGLPTPVGTTAQAACQCACPVASTQTQRLLRPPATRCPLPHSALFLKSGDSIPVHHIPRNFSESFIRPSNLSLSPIRSPSSFSVVPSLVETKGVSKRACVLL